MTRRYTTVTREEIPSHGHRQLAPQHDSYTFDPQPVVAPRRAHDLQPLPGIHELLRSSPPEAYSMMSMTPRSSSSSSSSLPRPTLPFMTAVTSAPHRRTKSLSIDRTGGKKRHTAKEKNRRDIEKQRRMAAESVLIDVFGFWLDGHRQSGHRHSENDTNAKVSGLVYEKGVIDRALNDSLSANNCFLDMFGLTESQKFAYASLLSGFRMGPDCGDEVSDNGYGTSQEQKQLYLAHFLHECCVQNGNHVGRQLVTSRFPSLDRDTATRNHMHNMLKDAAQRKRARDASSASAGDSKRNRMML